MSLKRYFCAIHNYTFQEGYKCMLCAERNLTQSTLEVEIPSRFLAMRTDGIQPGVDHFQDVDAKDRTGSAEYIISMLCRQDKEQLDRIEKMLKKILVRLK